MEYFHLIGRAHEWILPLWLPFLPRARKWIDRLEMFQAKSESLYRNVLFDTDPAIDDRLNPQPVYHLNADGDRQPSLMKVE